MGWKNLLVQIDGGRADGKRIDVAITLAQRFEAHLAGLFVIAEPTVPGFMVAQMPMDLRKEQIARRRKHAETAADGFRAALTRAGLPADCRIDSADEVDVAGVAALHGRHVDLMIVGQPDPDVPPPGGPWLVGDVALACGRPVLAVPYIGAGPAFGERVLVAWDGSREAARAVNDALPLLRRAAEVFVVAVNPPTEPGRLAGVDIALHLSRHGINVEAKTLEVRDIGVGDALLSHVGDLGADMLVMGAYGHTRFQESLFGGVTRQVQESMTVPVLLSH